jgi:hypothetical protein
MPVNPILGSQSPHPLMDKCTLSLDPADILLDDIVAFFCTSHATAARPRLQDDIISHKFSTPTSSMHHHVCRGRNVHEPICQPAHHPAHHTGHSVPAHVLRSGPHADQPLDNCTSAMLESPVPPVAPIPTPLPDGPLPCTWNTPDLLSERYLHLIALCVTMVAHMSDHYDHDTTLLLKAPHTTAPPLQECMGSRNELKPSIISTQGDTYLSSI